MWPASYIFFVCVHELRKISWLFKKSLFSLYSVLKNGIKWFLKFHPTHVPKKVIASRTDKWQVAKRQPAIIHISADSRSTSRMRDENSRDFSYQLTTNQNQKAIPKNKITLSSNEMQSFGVICVFYWVNIEKAKFRKVKFSLHRESMVIINENKNEPKVAS